MKTYMKQTMYGGALMLISASVFSQQKASGTIMDEEGININPVLVVNISNQQSTYTDISGNFAIEAGENDEIRFIKDGYYRIDKKMTRENFNTPLIISLKKREIEIPEVKITYVPTGNLEKDMKTLRESPKLRDLKSGLGDYMRSPLTEPLPDNTVSKTFAAPDFKAGQVSILGVLNGVSNLIKRARNPKITKANYIETQDFIRRVKTDINLDFFRKFGMNEEQIDQFLVYANDTRMMAKKYRKNFKKDVVLLELYAAFDQYSKLNKLDSL
ncbi:MAG: carboxypeptidase-like regulatory domain-containing protein [Chryseobacterium sp.]|uniref:hypothetical protein n=1 Tax=Chryseobacterium sp. TaxID=1871047 RepID=UPI002838AB87|nr:hypothetical protein [Chryseobacterium sp.]MDR2237265.1 carboxypeptidase-like regulatory domain-containing protein [Chryseobacterium sp.]